MEHTTIKLIYQDGVFRPLGRIQLPDNFVIEEEIPAPHSSSVVVLGDSWANFFKDADIDLTWEAIEAATAHHHTASLDRRS